MSRGAGLIPALGLVAVVIGLSACAGPSRTNDDFRHKVANTAESLDSDVQTGTLTAQLVLSHRVQMPYAATTVSEVEDDATAAQNTLDSRQPPSSDADDLKDKADPVFQQAVSNIADLRVALRRSNISDLPDLITQLQQSDHDLQPLEQVA
ncbi:MAG: hypothetical protein ACJ735_06285 [Actinomycetes bacterium]